MTRGHAWPRSGRDADDARLNENRSRCAAGSAPAGDPVLDGQDDLRDSASVSARRSGFWGWHPWPVLANVVPMSQPIIFVGGTHRGGEWTHSLRLDHRPHRLGEVNKELSGHGFHRLCTYLLDLSFAHPAPQCPPAGSFPNCLETSCKRPERFQSWKAFRKRKVRG